MKKILVPMLVLLSIALFHCKKDNSECTVMAQQVSYTGGLYASNPNVTNCAAYKSAIQAYLNSSCSASLSASDRQSLQNQMNNLSC